jgi:hypothetical protein
MGLVGGHGPATGGFRGLSPENLRAAARRPPLSVCRDRPSYETVC